MSSKRVKDYCAKVIWSLLFGSKFVPQGLAELLKYFYLYGPIEFDFKKEGDLIVAISRNFKFGSIITSANSKNALDLKIKDAILTSFEVPSSYSKEANIHRVDARKEAYAFA